MMHAVVTGIISAVKSKERDICQTVEDVAGKDQVKGIILYTLIPQPSIKMQECMRGYTCVCMYFN